MTGLFSLSVAENDGEAKVSLSGDVPLLITSRHLECS